MITIKTLQHVVEVDFGDSVESDLTFRIEVFLHSGAGGDLTFSAKVFRYDTFRFEILEASAIAALKSKSADHVVLVLDPMFGEQAILAASADDAVTQVLETIRKQLFL